LGVNGALQTFFEPFVITGGGPAGRSETFITKAYSYAFKWQNFGMASALGVILLCSIVVVLILQNIYSSKHQDGGGNDFE
jgi:raffinose/stachyose/melibiose transport system permease protein